MSDINGQYANKEMKFLYFPLVLQIYNPVVIGGAPLSLNKIVIHFYLEVCGFRHDIFWQFNKNVYL